MNHKEKDRRKKGKASPRGKALIRMHDLDDIVVKIISLIYVRSSKDILRNFLEH
jgi:hypothetical protein